MTDGSIVKPVYQKIAIDLANRIAHGEFVVGTKIHGRSTLASQYNVSPETIRRAVVLLEDMDIVSVSQGSGIKVKSQDQAYIFIERFQSKDSMSSIKKDILKMIEEKQKLDDQLTSNIGKLIDYSERFKNSNLFAPMEIEVPHDSNLVGKTIADSNFWQHTGATIIGLRRDNKFIISPGPYAGFFEGDIVLFIGEEGTYERAKSYMFESKK